VCNRYDLQLMTRGRESRWGIRALAVAALAVGAPAPALATAPGVDEYELNLQDGSGGDSTIEPEQTAPVAPVAPAPVTTTPIVPTETTQTTETTVLPPSDDKEKRHHEPPAILGETSVNASIGPGKATPLRVRAEPAGAPWLAIGLAGLLAVCCLAAVWRLRFLRELPASPRPGPSAGRGFRRLALGRRR
jgi:hypothetical protein